MTFVVACCLDHRFKFRVEILIFFFFTSFAFVAQKEQIFEADERESMNWTGF